MIVPIFLAILFASGLDAKSEAKTVVCSKNNAAGGNCISASGAIGHCSKGSCVSCAAAAKNGTECATFSGYPGTCIAAGSKDAACNTCARLADNKQCVLDSGNRGVCVKRICTVPPKQPLKMKPPTKAPAKAKPPAKAMPPAPAKKNSKP